MNKADFKNEELDALFDAWSTRMTLLGDGELFYKDGIMFKDGINPEQTIREWNESSRRVMFIVKDNPEGISGDARYWLTKSNSDGSPNNCWEQNQNLATPFMRRIAYMLWGLHHIDGQTDWWFPEVETHFESDIRPFFHKTPFAFIEAKKQPGRSSISDDALNEHLLRYKEDLHCEINLLNPTIIVCCGGPLNDFVVNLPEHKDTVTLLNPQNGRPSDNIHYIPSHHRLIIYAGHPSARCSYQDHYEGCFYWLREFLKQNPDAEY